MITTAALQPNSALAIEQRITAHQITWLWPVIMLVIRTLLFAFFQALIAAAYALQGTPDAWNASVPFWAVNATLTNSVCIVLLAVLARREGIRARDLYRFDRSRVGRDLLISLGFFVVAAPVVMLPNILLGNLLFGDVARTMPIMFRPIPQWIAVINLVLFPLTIAFAELPTYYGYVRPRLEALTGSPWVAVGLACFFHALQHCALPLVFDGRFLLWRLGMFLPFAALTAIMLRWRPSFFPYAMLIHGLLDLQVCVMILMA